MANLYLLRYRLLNDVLLGLWLGRVLDKVDEFVWRGGVLDVLSGDLRALRR